MSGKGLHKTVISPPSVTVRRYETREDSIAAKLAASLMRLEAVEDADVQLSLSLVGTGRSHPKAAVTLNLAGAELSDQQLAGLTSLVTSGVEGLGPRHVVILDVSGRPLNAKAARIQERKEFWTGIAINVSKILGILAMLITLRFIIQAIGRGVAGEDIQC